MSINEIKTRLSHLVSHLVGKYDFPYLSMELGLNYFDLDGEMKILSSRTKNDFTSFVVYKSEAFIVVGEEIRKYPYSSNHNKSLKSYCSIEHNGDANKIIKKLSKRSAGHEGKCVSRVAEIIQGRQA